MKTHIQLLLIGWILAAGHCQAKAAKHENWHRGKVELVSGTALDGELNYNWKADIVQLRQADGTVKAYSAFQVNRFIYFDTECNALRTFASIDFPVKPTLQRRLFLEEYATGPMTVYRRLRHQHEPIRMANLAQYGASELVFDDIDNFIYYVFTDTKSIIELNHFERDLWPRMKDEFGGSLNQYRSSQHLDMSTTLTRVLLIAHYNVLQSEHIAASAPAEVLLDRQE